MLIHTGGNGHLARLLSIDIHSADRYEGFGRPGLFQAPGIAPSGRYWAFDEEDSDGGRHLVITSHTRETRLALEHVGGVAFGWSPTSDLLAYICPTRSFHHFYGPLRLFDVASQQQRILADETVLAFFWSPDGQQIAYLTMATAPPLAHAGGWAPGNGVSSNGQRNGSNGHMPPPHTSVRPSTEDDPILNMWVVDVQSNQRRLLTAFQPSEEFVTQFMPFFDQYILSHRLWSPASDALVLSIVADQRPQVMIMPLNGDQPRIIAEGSMAFWSPHPAG
jgi:TolB protein